MSLETADAMVPAPAYSETTVPPTTHSSARPARLWPALSILGLYWGATVGMQFVEVPYFFRFVFQMAAPALLLIAFSIWWWRNRSIGRGDRCLGYGLVVGGALATAPLTHPSIGLPVTLMSGLPFILSLWMLWTLLLQRFIISRRRVASVALVASAFGCLALIRTEGVDGDLRASMHWRWTPTAEDLFLAHQEDSSSAALSLVSATQLTLTPEDWPGFRGSDRAGIALSPPISTDWEVTPPKLLWKQRIGPAWSSVVVIGERLFTQEQRGEYEVVVCYEAQTGRELWVHQDTARFWESVSGAGPRATPTFSDGRIYTLGATGLLNCLDAATGAKLWSHSLETEASAKIPLWGVSCSPLVVDGIVVVYGGGEKQNNLLAYDAETGLLKWTTAAGVSSYSSPQFVTLDDQPQILMISDGGLTAVEPGTGTQLWQAGIPMPGTPRALLAQMSDGTKFLTPSLTGLGVSLIEVNRGDNGWSSNERWTTATVKPEFSDFVVNGGQAFGFDGALFCCLDIATGKRLWKAGRYGRGQVVLLPEQSLLLVLSETGEAILVAANPQQHQELGRFQAVSGKTWNHPVIAHGRLYARNAEEIAAYELPVVTGP